MRSGEPFELEAECGAYVRADEEYVVDNQGPDDLLVPSDFTRSLK